MGKGKTTGLTPLMVSEWADMVKQVPKAVPA